MLTHPDQELLQLKPQTERSQLTTYFHADTSQRDTSPWTFKPTPHKIKVYPGDTALTFYIAQNKTNEAKPGILVHHTNPQKVGIHPNKTQRLCLEEQRPKASESIETPIPPSTDPDPEEDPKTRDVDPTTPSHTSPESHQRISLARTANPMSTKSKNLSLMERPFFVASSLSQTDRQPHSSSPLERKSRGGAQ